MPDSALCADDRAKKPVFSTAETVTKQHSSECMCVYMVFADAFLRKREKTEVKCGDTSLYEADSGVRTGETERFYQMKARAARAVLYRRGLY